MTRSSCTRVGTTALGLSFRYCWFLGVAGPQIQMDQITFQSFFCQCGSNLRGADRHVVVIEREHF